MMVGVTVGYVVKGVMVECKVDMGAVVESELVTSVTIANVLWASDADWNF